MSINIEFDSGKNVSLVSLQSFIQQTEQLLGPLVGIGHNTNQNVVSIDDNLPPPNNYAILKVAVGVNVTNLTNHLVICQGACFINNQLIQLIAYRPL